MDSIENDIDNHIKHMEDDDDDNIDDDNEIDEDDDDHNTAEQDDDFSDEILNEQNEVLPAECCLFDNAYEILNDK